MSVKPTKVFKVRPSARQTDNCQVDVHQEIPFERSVASKTQKMGRHKELWDAGQDCAGVQPRALPRQSKTTVLHRLVTIQLASLTRN